MSACVYQFHRTFYFLVIKVYGSGVSSYTCALNKWLRTHWGNMLQLHGCHGWEEDYSIVSCLLKHLTRKIKLKTLLDVSMYHTSLSGVRNVKFQTLLLGKCILTIRLTTKSVPPPQEHSRVFSVNYLFREANIVYHRKYHNIP